MQVFFLFWFFLINVTLSWIRCLLFVILFLICWISYLSYFALKTFLSYFFLWFLQVVISRVHRTEYDTIYLQKQPSRGVLKKRCSENMLQIYWRTPIPKCDFNKVSMQLYWNCSSAWVFPCKFAAYFQNTFS